MPSYLAQRVRTEIDQRHTHSINHRAVTPVVVGRSASRPSTYVFVVAGRLSGRGLSTHTLTQLDEAGVRLLDSGQRIWLPTTDYPTGWTWKSAPPTPGIRLPTPTTVLTTAQELLLRTRRGSLRG
ncbi:hypothetical protein ABZ540_33780 [Nocardia xishanensis]|uniref:hypothetical protein n=1 Tax=Nocardia xishanensis TaxID=238964 RepID=UPI003403050D